MNFSRGTPLVQFIFVTGLLLFLSAGVLVKETSATSYTGREYRDPTRSPLFVKPASEEAKPTVDIVRLPLLSIQGIIWGGDSPRAIIDGQVVAKGEILPEGVEILDISNAGIKVLYRGKIFTLNPPGRAEE
ncbi:MAG: hypothetical protein ABH845_04080 [Candidatus Omnitrophota bacterium]